MNLPSVTLDPPAAELAVLRLDGKLCGYWVRPAGVRTATAVMALNEAGGFTRLGRARTRQQARLLMQCHVGRVTA